MSEKLKEIIENMPKDVLINSFETVYEDSIKKDLEIERLQSIIKEVREVIEERCREEIGGIAWYIKNILDKGSGKYESNRFIK